MIKKLLLITLAIGFTFGATITIPTKNTNDSLTNTEFNQLIEALRYNTRSVSSLDVVGTVSASELQVNGQITATSLTVKGTISANSYTASNQPYIYVSRGSVQNVNNASQTTITFDVLERSSGGASLTSSTNLIAPVDGLYLITARITFASNATGYRKMFILKGGSNLFVGASAAANGDTTESQCSGVAYLNASDSIRFDVYQNSGGALNVGSAAVLMQCGMVKLN